jgi:hypothetical protein
MAEQLLYNNERKTTDIDVSMPRADDRDLVFKHVLGPSAAVKEARFHVADTNDVVTIALALDTHPTQWDFTTDDEGTISIASADTVGVTLGEYNYAIELIDQNDLVYTVQRGGFTLSDDIVANTGTAPYLSWSTRDDLDDDVEALEDDIVQMASCGDFSFLTVAIAGGEGTITVANGAIFTGTPNIRVMLDNGTYEDDSVASKVGNVLTLSGTIAGVAAIGQPVRIL